MAPDNIETLNDLLDGLPQPVPPVEAPELEDILLEITAAVGRLAMIARRSEMSERPLPKLNWGQKWGLVQAQREINHFLDGTP